jgi:hypothetical protein
MSINQMVKQIARKDIIVAAAGAASGVMLALTYIYIR